MKRLWLLAIAMLSVSTVAAGQTGTAPPALPQIKSADGKLIQRAQPVQCVNNAGNEVACGGGSSSGPTASTSDGTNGAAPPSGVSVVAGSDGTVARTLRTDGNGALQVYSLSGSPIAVGGTVANAATDSGSPVKIGGYANSAGPVAVSNGQRVNGWFDLNGAQVTTLRTASQADAAAGAYLAAQAPGGAAGPLSVGTYVFNGTTADRARSATAANATTGTGLLGAGILGQYQTTLPTYTAGQFGTATMDSRGNLGVFLKGSSGVGADATANTAFTSAGVTSDNTATGNIRMTATGNMLFNNTTWDRQRDANSSAGTTGIGLLGSVSLGLVSATPPTGTAVGSYVRPWMDFAGRTVVQMVDSAGNNVAIRAPADAAGGEAGLTTISRNTIWNGTGFDRQKKANAVSRIPSAAAGGNVTVAKASTGDVHAIHAYNTTTTVRFFKLYNKATAPVFGTDIPVMTLAIPPGGNLDFELPDGGLYLTAGIAYALTAGAADTDTTALAAGDVVALNVTFD